MSTLFNYGFVSQTPSQSTISEQERQRKQCPPSPPGSRNKYDEIRCLPATPPDTPPRTPPRTPLPALPLTTRKRSTADIESPTHTQSRDLRYLRQASNCKQTDNGRRMAGAVAEMSSRSVLTPAPFKVNPGAQLDLPQQKSVEDEVAFVAPPVFTATISQVSDSMPHARTGSKSLYDNERIRQVITAKQLVALDTSSHGFSQSSFLRQKFRAPDAAAWVDSLTRQKGSSKSKSVPTHVQQPERRMALTPIEMDLGALEFIANLPVSARSPARKNSIEDFLHRATLKRSATASTGTTVMAVELPGGPMIAVVTPEQSAWKRTKFLPGRIRLEANLNKERSPLEIFQETFGPDQIDGHIDAEEPIADELNSFVQSYGKGFKIKEKGFDAYWLQTRSPIESGSKHGRSFHCNKPFKSPAAGRLVVPNATRWDRQVPSGRLHELSKERDRKHNPIHKDPPEARLERNSYASSSHSGSTRTGLSTARSSNRFRMSMGITGSVSPIKSLKLLPVTPTSGEPGCSSGPNGRRVKAVKGKGPRAGQKLSIRGLIRSAASIV